MSFSRPLQFSLSLWVNTTTPPVPMGSVVLGHDDRLSVTDSTNELTAEMMQEMLHELNSQAEIMLPGQSVFTALMSMTGVDVFPRGTPHFAEAVMAWFDMRGVIATPKGEEPHP